MKKTAARALSAIIAGAMILTMAGCSDSTVTKRGILVMSEEETNSAISDAVNTDGAEKGKISTDSDRVFFNSTNDMMIALETGKISIACLPAICGAYFLSKNPDYVMCAHKNSVGFQMALMKENGDLRNSINAAIDELETDGTLETMANEYLLGYLADDLTTPVDKGEPTYSEIPTIDGAPTLKVAITGDMPPLDYISADGKPAGFNVALMGKLAEKLNYNIEFVSITADARAAALSSGKADIIFWYQNSVGYELSSDTLLFTRNYFTSLRAAVGKYSSEEELNKALFNGTMQLAK